MVVVVEEGAEHLRLEPVTMLCPPLLLQLSVEWVAAELLTPWLCRWWLTALCLQSICNTKDKTVELLSRFFPCVFFCENHELFKTFCTRHLKQALLLHLKKCKLTVILRSPTRRIPSQRTENLLPKMLQNAEFFHKCE